MDYLRTGTISGRVVQTAGGRTAGVSGATVYLAAAATATCRAPPSAPSPAVDGTYNINGVEPGTYGVVAFRSGYTRSTSRTAVTVEGDTTGTEDTLDIEPLPDGTITGTVMSAAGSLINGATVTFTSLDGQTVVSGTTGGAAGNGGYSINAPAGTYTGVATDSPAFGPSATSGQITVTSGQTVTPPVNFTLTVAVGGITGTVTNASGTGIVGATVVATPTGGGAATTATTGAGGVYNFTGLITGTYTLSAAKTGFFPQNTATATVTGGGTATASNPIILVPAVNVTLQGQVTAGGTGLSGATVTITNLDGTVPAFTVATGTAGANPGRSRPTPPGTTPSPSSRAPTT